MSVKQTALLFTTLVFAQVQPAAADDSKLAAIKHGAAEVVDPPPYAVGSLSQVLQRYPRIGTLLPAMGYGGQQIEDLRATIARTPCDLVLFSTPIHLCNLVACRKPTLRVRYDYADHGEPRLEDVLRKRMAAARWS